MHPDPGQTELKEATRLFKARMVRAALSHLGEIDIRTAIALELSGAIERNHDVTLGGHVIEIIGDQSHPLRNKTSFGPFLFYRENEQAKSQYALDMTEVLLSDHSASRVAAVKHFQSLAFSPLAITSKSQRFLNDLQNDISSSDLITWQAAALKVHDALRDDLLCILAGAKQSIEQRYEDGIQQYFPRLLRPSLNSLDALDVELLRPEEKRNTGAQVIQKIVDISNSLEAACATYLESVGFLPLDGDSSFSELMRQWIARRGSPPDVWGIIWRWVNESTSSLAAYHACLYFLETVSSIPEGQQSYFWSQLLKVLDAQNNNEQKDSRVSEWSLRAELARHYLQFLEVRLPGGEGDTLARLALWITERVVTLVGRDLATIERFRNVAIIPEVIGSGFAWRLANPPVIQAPLTLATHGLVSIWALSLLPRMTRSALQAIKAGITEGALESIEKTMTDLFLRGFPVSRKEPEQLVYAFEGLIEPVVEAWIAEYGESERTRFARSINALHLKLLDPDEFSVVLNTLCDEESEAEQLLIANCALILGKQGTLPLEPVWNHLSNAEWRTNCFKKLPESVLEILFTTCSASLNRAGKLWATELPHFYASACEDCVDDKERSDLFFAWTLLTCVHTYSVSAIERLLTGRRAGRFVENVARWRRVLVDQTNSSAPWVTARLRAILAALSAG